jgi:hypothetical protein
MKKQLSPYSSPGCFIATAVYPSNCVQLQTFRNFRDNVLLRNRIGKYLVHFYYRVSPKIADYIKDKKIVKKFILYFILEPTYKLVKLFFK